jgi:short-subunit dehydrogenase
VVTGAGGSIGTEICRRLAARGHEIIAVDVDDAGLKTLQANVSRVTPVRCDLTDPTDMARLADVVGDDCAVLVHAAGLVVTTPFERVTDAEIQREVGVNLLAPMLLTRALFPALRASRGHVVGVASLGSMLPMGESPGYSASKFGLRGFLLALAARSPATGVRTSIVNPGAVDTPMLRHEAATGGSALNFIGTPLEPDQVAQAVVSALDRPRAEINVPRADGWLVKVGMLAPGLLLRLLPTAARLAQGNLTRYREKYGIVEGTTA